MDPDHSNHVVPTQAAAPTAFAALADGSRPWTPRVAIIGTEGSGKTILVTSLAKRFSRAGTNGAYLSPLTNRTIRYVEQNWQTLVAGEWPAGTPLGQLIELQWRLETTGDRRIQCDLRMVDVAGQDVRRWLSEDEPGDGPVRPGPLEELVRHCQTADIVICLVNLQDFLGEGDPERKLDNEIVITAALRRLAADPARRLCLLFTQVDLYQGTLQRFGGDWNRIAREFLPYAHGAQLSKGQAVVRAVASVSQTVVIVAADGRPRRVPAPDFQSFGLDGLMAWLVEQVRTIDLARDAASQAAQHAEAIRREREQQGIGLMALTVLTIAIFVVGWWGCTAPPGPKPLVVEQYRPLVWGQPSNIEATLEFGRFRDAVVITNNSDQCLRYLKITLAEKSTGYGVKTEELRDIPARQSCALTIPAQISRDDNIVLRVDWYE